MQKLHNPPVQIQEMPTRRQKVFAFFKDKKEWVKLNASYVVATGTNFGVAMASAHLAQKAGVSKESATSWIAFVSGFTAGFAALIGTWYFLHVDKYQKDIGKIAIFILVRKDGKLIINREFNNYSTGKSIILDLEKKPETQSNETINQTVLTNISVNETLATNLTNVTENTINETENLENNENFK